MRKIFLALAMLATLGACQFGSISSVPTAPSQIADRTVADEQGMLAVELAYKAARLAVETGVDAGIIRGATAARFAELDNKAFAALGVLRQAYRTANAADFATALTNARNAVALLLTLTGK